MVGGGSPILDEDLPPGVRTPTRTHPPVLHRRSGSISTAAPSRAGLPALTPQLALPHPNPKAIRRRMRGIPFIVIHVLALVGAVLVAPTWAAVGIGLAVYFVRMFGVTGGYHRYFAHRAYKTSRWFQFVLAWIGCAAMQKGPLWWASHHRQHHRNSDQEDDPALPRSSGRCGGRTSGG